GDVVLMGSNAGTTYRAIETADIAHGRGAKVVALTQVVYEDDPTVILFHPTGKRLHDVADVVIDLGGHVGDGALTFPAIDARVIPSSGVTGMMALWMILSQTTELVLVAGKVPMVYQSLQIPGAIDRNDRLVAEYGRTRRGYLNPDRSQ
ncbi:MAG TPA: sugar isomerase, partial [Chloroflexota bacterium]|nr:sugar isomerase [Chloroflexota bacterium]